MNNWENRPKEFLSKAFNKDEDDIIECLLDIGPSTIMEVGFGNNRLLPAVLDSLYPVNYYGFDKTRSFVTRANNRFNLQGVHFDILDIECLDSVKDKLSKVNPEVVILRHIIDHLTSWKDVILTLNQSSIQNILMSLFTKSPRLSSWTSVEGRAKHKYIVNHIHDGELCNVLDSYKCIKDCTYKDHPHRFKYFKKIN